MMTPKLMTFGLSHYCEKARWALDWHGIAFEEVGWPPGLHIALARRLGAANHSLPILSAGDTLVQGSNEIIDWAERQGAGIRPSLAPDDDRLDAQAIRDRADQVLGIHVRRLFYAEVLPHEHQLAKPWLFLNASARHRLVGNLVWPAVRKIMIRSMDTPPEAAPDSRAKLEAELEWLDAMLADGRPYLAGERFSRVDLTVAALLAPFARPSQAAVYRAITLPPALARDVERWRARPVMTWVNRIYEQHRSSSER
jgi:glutathione S-transferase